MPSPFRRHARREGVANQSLSTNDFGRGERSPQADRQWDAVSPVVLGLRGSLQHPWFWRCC